MKIESTAVMSNPRADPHTILLRGQPLTQVKPASANNHTPAPMASTSSPLPSLEAQHQPFRELVLVHLQMLGLELMLPFKAAAQVRDAGVVCLQVVVEALFTQQPSQPVKVFIIVVSLILGLLILAALIWCLWKVNIFYFAKQSSINV